MNGIQIKNLAIALEALSRIQGTEAEFRDVKNLLDNEIRKAEEQNHKDWLETQTPPDRSNPADDIPF